MQDSLLILLIWKINSKIMDILISYYLLGTNFTLLSELLFS